MTHKGCFRLISGIALLATFVIAAPRTSLAGKAKDKSADPDASFIKDVEIEVGLRSNAADMAAIAAADRQAEQDGVKEIYTLEDCIRIAIDRSPKVRASGYGIEAAKGQLEEAKANFWPVMEYNYRIAPVPVNVDRAFDSFFEGQVTLFNSIHVGFGVPLTTFGQLNLARKLATGGVEAARIEEAKSREVTTFQVKQLYYGTLLAQETIKLLEDAVDKLSNKVAEEEAKGASPVGDVAPRESTDGDLVDKLDDEASEGQGETPANDRMDPYDLFQLKITKVDLERRLAEAKQNLALALEGLSIQMNLEPGTEVRLDASNLKPVLVALGDEQTYIDAAMQNQPEAKLLEIGVSSKRLQYRLQKYKLVPSMGFGFPCTLR